MANWAIVIGIDEYWLPNANLQGAVRDALSFLKWLLEPEPTGGGVPESNLYLLLAPPPTDQPIPLKVNTQFSPTRRGIYDAIDNLLKSSQGAGERFYFYYAGHGMTVRSPAGPLEPILIASDFSYGPDESWSIPSIYNLFQSSHLMDQFFFIDACRNMPLEGPVRIKPGRMDEPPAATPPVRQHKLYATSPGQPAAEFADFKNEQGAFTTALIEGLRGQGMAKAWDRGTRQYVVLVERLCKFIKRQVKRRLTSLTQDQKDNQNNEAVFVQLPRYNVDNYEHPIPPIVRFPPNHNFANEELEIHLNPSSMLFSGKILVAHSPLEIREEVVSTHTIKISLPPKEYQVAADMPGYLPKPDQCIVELYEFQQVDFDLS